MSVERDHVQVLGPEDWGPDLPVIEGRGSCNEIIGPRTGTQLRSLYYLRLEQLSQTVTFRHPDEAVYYVAEGEATVASEGGERVELPLGGMVHIRPGVPYVVSTVAGATLVGGPSPVDPAFAGGGSGTGAHREPALIPGIRAFHRDEPGLRVPMISADARLVVWYGVGATNANMNFVVLEPGERNKEHLHRSSDDTIFILEGRGTAEDVTNGVKLPFGPGSTVTIPPGVIHTIAADQGERVVSAGGPCPADLDMLRAAGVDVDALTMEMAAR